MRMFPESTAHFDGHVIFNFVRFLNGNETLLHT